MGVMFFDRLASLVSGLGTHKDKATSVFHAPTYMDWQQLINAYRGDWIARKVVDLPALDMVRAWRNWQADADQIEAIEAEEKRLKLKQRCAQALKWARLFGGAALLLGTDDPDPTQPLNFNRIGLGGLTYVHVCSLLEVTAGPLDRDPMSPGYGEPIYYRINRVQTLGQPGTQTGIVTVHPSRVIRFIGAELPDPNYFGTGSWVQGWGDSVLQAVNDAVINAGMTSGGIAGLVLEAKIDVFKIKGLTANVSNADYRSRMIERFALANQAKSLQNALIMDAEEDYQQKQISFTGLTDVLTLYLEIAAAAADIPATRMLAKQSKGLGNGGEGDLKNYYDKVASDQEMTLRPNLEKLDEVLIRSALGVRPPEVHFTFAPLWQMSDLERAEIRAKNAASVASLAASGTIPKAALAASVQNQLTENGDYPGLEGALDDLGEAGEGRVWTGVSTTEVKDWLAMWQAGAITQETLFNRLQDGRIIDPDATFDAYVEQIEAEGPAPTEGEENVLVVPPAAAADPTPDKLAA